MSAPTPESIVSLQGCLPAELRGPGTTLTRVGAGLSGAAVYRVDAGGRAFVLKVSREDEPLAAWQKRLAVQRRAADAGLAPRVLHADETRRALVSAFVVDRSFPAFYGNPSTREMAIAQLGRTLRRVHSLPLLDAEPKDRREFLVRIWSTLPSQVALPDFVADAVTRVLAEAEPAAERPPVLSHNDVNPTNLAWDGEQLMLLDWDTAGRNDPFHDLATISVFLRMDDDACRRLLASYDGAGPVAALPAPFAYGRRFVAAFAGTMMLQLAGNSGHNGATGDETLAATPSLGDFYQMLRAGALSLATADGLWAFGLAMVKESAAL